MKPLSSAGDLRPLFSDQFDTGIGAKIQPAPYAHIAEHIGTRPGPIVFVADHVKELEAAALVGLQIVHAVKDDTQPSPGLPAITDFDQIEIA